MRFVLLFLTAFVLASCAPGVTYTGPVSTTGTPQEAIIRLANVAPGLSTSEGAFDPDYSNFSIVSIQATALTLRAEGSDGSTAVITCTAAETETGAAVTCTPENLSQHLYAAL